MVAKTIKCPVKDCEFKPVPSTLNYKVDSRNSQTQEPDTYKQTIRWRCTNNHVYLTSKVISAVMLEQLKTEKPENSSNRFKRRGYKGHRVNPPKKRNTEFNFPALMSNRERNQWRRERRAEVKQMDGQL